MKFRQCLSIMFCLLPFYLVACSAGTSSTSTSQTGGYSGPNQNLGYYVFSGESHITVPLGSTTEEVVLLLGATSEIPGSVYFNMSDPGVVTLTSDSCNLDYNQNPPSCIIYINAIGIGTTKIAASGPGSPLYVTVVN